MAPFTILPDVGGSVLRCSGTFTYRDVAPGRSERATDGELTVKVPLVGGRAEKALAPAIVGRLDGEAQALQRRLGGAGPSPAADQ